MLIDRHRPSVAALAVMILIWSGTILSGALTARGPAEATTNRQDQSPATALVDEMQHHLTDVTRLHEAVVRGDLPAARRIAGTLARLQVDTAAALGATGPQFIATIRTDAQRAAAAPDLAAAAAATAQMLDACGACHAAAGRVVSTAASERSLDTVTGEMHEHRRAVNELLLGLVVPSARLWSEGAARLGRAPVSIGTLRLGAELAAAIEQAERRMQQLAGVAARADSAPARTAAYAELLTTCAACHARNANRGNRGFGG